MILYTAGTWKHPEGLLKDEWIKKMWYIYTYIHNIHTYIYIYIHTHNGILLSHKKEINWVICSDVNEPRICHP